MMKRAPFWWLRAGYRIDCASRCRFRSFSSTSWCLRLLLNLWSLRRSLSATCGIRGSLRLCRLMRIFGCFLRLPCHARWPILLQYMQIVWNSCSWRPDNIHRQKQLQLRHRRRLNECWRSDLRNIQTCSFHFQCCLLLYLSAANIHHCRK